MTTEILHGDCRELIAAMPDNSVDAIVTDPPYELGFMGKAWDSTGIAYDIDLWRECLRVMKPGGHLLAFGGSRTYHRLACAIEDAGWQIRDQIMWVYGSGFPKSLNLKDEYAGWGTALKPAHEPIVMARKPLAGTVADNVQTWGTGAINIDGTRIASDDGFEKAWDKPVSTNISSTAQAFSTGTAKTHLVDLSATKPVGGRWPANFIHDGSDETNVLLGGAARFFYCAKPSKAERNAGCEEMPLRHYTSANKMGGSADTMLTGSGNPRDSRKHNHHPTVKPLALMRYLIRLITPPNGTVLDPFAGSGTTLMAAIMEGHPAIGCELTAEYLPIIGARTKWAEEQKTTDQPTLFGDPA